MSIEIGCKQKKLKLFWGGKPIFSHSKWRDTLTDLTKTPIFIAKSSCIMKIRKFGATQRLIFKSNFMVEKRLTAWFEVNIWFQKNSLFDSRCSNCPHPLLWGLKWFYKKNFDTILQFFFGKISSKMVQIWLMHIFRSLRKYLHPQSPKVS